MNREKIIVSACLAGQCCRYDGKNSLVEGIAELVRKGLAIPLCPEVMGGLSVPRKPCEILLVKGETKVYNEDNEDMTAYFRQGAEKALSVALANYCRSAILKSKSPSCGAGTIYDGSFNRKTTSGDGLTARLFKQNGIRVITETEWLEGVCMDTKKNVGIVFGGQSGEHEVSLVSATNIIDVIDQNKYDITKIGITKDGEVMLYRGDTKNIADGSWLDDEANLIKDITFLNDPRLAAVDVYFPVLHGPMGEDGTIQGIFEFMNKPYVGCGVTASAVGMDKVLTKMVCEKAGVPTGPYSHFTKWDWEKDSPTLIRDIEERGYPVFIKPVNMGSSVGITKAHNRSELEAGIEEAFIYDQHIIVEETIDGRELECAVLEQDGEYKVATPGEIVASKEFYDYEAKYAADQNSEIIIPAQLPEETLSQLQTYALKVFTALGCSGLSRVDFFVTRDSGEVYLNEINTLPGFTNISMFPKMWEADGIPYPELVEILIQNASRKRVH